MGSVDRFEPLTGDASFRRYYRAYSKGQNYIVMDAPPAREGLQAYIAIAEQLQQAGLNVPEIIAVDQAQGFLLETDFGDTLLFDALNPATVSSLYRQAMNELFKIQTCALDVADYSLPKFCEKLYRQEFELFTDWYLQRALGLQLSSSAQVVLSQLFEHLLSVALKQPQVFVHRDYHSRNLMCLSSGGLGVLDFQDAVAGPITYDLLSLLRDCYIDWPAAKVREWVKIYYQEAKDRQLVSVSFDEFYYWFDCMSLQRHLKCIGIFSRLNLRDKKPSYLQYIPRIFNYIDEVANRYSEFSKLSELLQHCCVEG